MKKIRIKTPRPFIAYPGSTIQQNYGEDKTHGYLVWDIESADSFDVRFQELKNKRPFITISWAGTVDKTIDENERNIVEACRVRIHSQEQLSQRDVIDLLNRLKTKHKVTEVTFKTDNQVSTDVIKAGASSIIKADLRNPDILIKLVKEYHKDIKNVTDEEWLTVTDMIKGYLSVITAPDETIVRNTKWSIKHLKFDNTFAYGEGNVINFDNMSGIIGIFGPNRSGKSSIVGTLMYALFNGTDRGVIKNLHIVNARKPWCYTRAIIDVNGTNYVIERQTTKNENRRGVNASTALNVFRLEDGEAIDLAGEQRNDTEKVIRNLIGSPDDCLLTSIAAQDEIKSFIMQGATKRKQALARFLDLDVFEKLFDASKNDVNGLKHALRNFPDKDWDRLESEHEKTIDDASNGIISKESLLDEAKEKIDSIRRKLMTHSDVTPVTKSSVELQKSRLDAARTKFESTNKRVEELKDSIQKSNDRLDSAKDLISKYDVAELTKRHAAYEVLKSSVVSLKHAHERELTHKQQQERSLKILDQVPCGTSFPTCKFIKDAHLAKEKLPAQHELVSKSLDNLHRAEEALDVIMQDDSKTKLEKAQQLELLISRLGAELSSKKLELVNEEVSRDSLATVFEHASNRYHEMEEAFKNDENVELVTLRTELEQSQIVLKTLENERLSLTSTVARYSALLERLRGEREQREQLLNRMRLFELVSSAFSKRGIPSLITASQLPLINAEIARILHGIVDFTVEIEVSDEDGDISDVYINYGDSKRVIELGSGMEKMIASVAIRVALINVSSLPKTDMFIIDEGFGALDDSGVEACNRLLASLKRYFKMIIVITHVDGVKDAADHVIDVTKIEKDSKVTFL